MLFFAPKCVVCGEAAAVEKVGDFRLPWSDCLILRESEKNFWHSL